MRTQKRRQCTIITVAEANSVKATWPHSFVRKPTKQRVKYISTTRHRDAVVQRAELSGGSMLACVILKRVSCCRGRSLVVDTAEMCRSTSWPLNKRFQIAAAKRRV